MKNEHRAIAREKRKEKKEKRGKNEKRNGKNIREGASVIKVPPIQLRNKTRHVIIVLVLSQVVPRRHMAT